MSTSLIDYTIRIPLKESGERIGCTHCAHFNDCQYYLEIFSEHPRTRFRFQLINNRRESDYIGLICKYFEQTPVQSTNYPVSESNSSPQPQDVE